MYYPGDARKQGWQEQDPLELYRSVKIVVQAVGDELKVHHGSILT